MSSGKHKNTFMSFNTFKDIIDSCSSEFELQLEGGEPLLHGDLYLFLWYAHSTQRCKRVIITTNGMLLRTHIEPLIWFASHTNIKVLIKRSINYHLINENKNLLKECRDMHLATEFIDIFDIRFNVRLRHGDEELIELLKVNKIFDQSDVYYLQSYGKLEDNTEYEKPVIKQNVDAWFLYSCDGANFGTDLVARANHEKDLQ